jgi:Domain of unknown function (DUF4132)
MGIFDFFKKKGVSGRRLEPPRDIPKQPSAEQQAQRDHFEQIIGDLRKEMTARGDTHDYFKPNDCLVFKGRVLTMTDKQKVAFICEATDTAYLDIVQRAVCNRLLEQLILMALQVDDEDVAAIYEAFESNKKYTHNQSVLDWPVHGLITQVERRFRKGPVSEGVAITLGRLRASLDKRGPGYQEKNRMKYLERIDRMLFETKHGKDKVKPTLFPALDTFGKYANESIERLDEQERVYWYRLIQLGQKGTGGKPTKKMLDEGKLIFQEMGADKFKKVVVDWMQFLIDFKEPEQALNAYFLLVAESNVPILKGLIWLCSHFHDQLTLSTAAALADRCYRKRPGSGATAPAIGNACFYSLANSKGLDGVAHLSRLKLRIKQSNTAALIDKYLQEAANEEGVSVYEIEDMAVDDYGLVDGQREYELDGHKAVLLIVGVGKTEIRWFKPDGSPQKSAPAAVKENHAEKLKKIKETAKQVEVTLATQRDRLDRMMKANRVMEWERFQDLYFMHGLMSWLVRRLIWNVESKDGIRPLLFLDGRWVDGTGASVMMSDPVKASLWHPVQSSAEETKAWRDLLLGRDLAQPFKQAFREVYLLTDAELNTRTYSNRMAAHILKQHQFNSLAKARGWRYALRGAFDNGSDYGSATIALPEYQLRAEYWISEVNSENAFNDTGMWLYVATDQVRFINLGTLQMMELAGVPAIPFSEVMRDVDLFVGVASVGNDPTWRDGGGLPAYRDYWQSYSFGELTEVAKTRKQILERLLPRLKIARVVEIRDKFLFVKGKLRTYKIHLGSTNILMEPNDQYLCIVPDRKSDARPGEVFLPFEGDGALSVILSKAFLLAEDDKITDVTITRQLALK